MVGRRVGGTVGRLIYSLIYSAIWILDTVYKYQHIQIHPRIQRGIDGVRTLEYRYQVYIGYR